MRGGRASWLIMKYQEEVVVAIELGYNMPISRYLVFLVPSPFFSFPFFFFF